MATADLKLQGPKMGTEAAEYLDKHNVYDLFADLLDQLAIHKPADPIQFLIDKLRNPPALKVVFIGPPGSGKTSLCRRAADEFGLVLISTAELLRREAGRSTDVGRQIKSHIRNGQNVPDELVMPLLVEQLNLPECSRAGYVLDGFPATRSQASLLQAAGVVPTKFVMLDLPPTEAAQRLANRKDPLCLSDEQTNARTLASYQANANQVVDLFRDSIFLLDGMGTPDQVYGRLAQHLRTPLITNAPHRPPRVVVIGPPGSGKSAVSEYLARYYTCQHITLSGLLRETTLSDDQLSKSFKSGDPVTEDRLLELLFKRLRESDCMRTGWVLDGFPVNPSQAQKLVQAGFQPTRLVVLKIEPAVAVKNCAQRKYDPKTDRVYSMLGKDVPQEADIGARLLPKLPQDESTITATCASYSQQSEGIIKNLQTTMRSFDATSLGQGLLDEVCAFIVKSDQTVPRK